jgi:hypothetical protein
MSHIAARNEIRELIGSLRLGRRGGEGGVVAVSPPTMLASATPAAAVN